MVGHLKLVVKTKSPQETRLLGQVLADLAGDGAIFALEGDLGAGKTVFTQGVARALGITDPITSPTFTLVNEYEGDPPLYHVDLYRMGGSLDVWDLGLEDYLGGRGIVVVEWAERGGELLAFPLVWRVYISIVGGDERKMEIVIPPGVDCRDLREALATNGIEVLEWKES